MPIANISDAREVEDCLARVLLADDIHQRIAAMRRLFVEALDYEPDDRLIPLDNGSGLPRDAYMVARRDGVSAVYVELSGDRVTNRDATAAARSLSEVLGDDLLLLFTNGPCDQFHVIHPSFSGSRPALSRMVVRRGEHHRTVVQQIANMWNDYGRMGKSIQEAIRQAFSVEPVTKAFFQAYRDIFQESESKITGFGSDTNGYEDRRRFTQTMFNRLMFVYFLSRKGWLSFGGDTDYLNALWKDYPGGPDDNFYNDRLAPLFFAGLNNQQSLDLNRNNLTLHGLIGDVPFLNGGLFEKNELDKRNDEFTVPDDAIEPILRDLFDKFNFTVMESTPYDTEVAVDPEMLGKVFEELVTERHSSGAYYTPRPVVAFMCREALKGYLEGQDTGLTAEEISGFVDQQSTENISVAAARRLANALEEVTVVDPACGSGAYLLGMMQELIELQTVLYNAGVDSKAIYDLKLEIIQRNLYGVDIEEFAVNIAMLRLWLSLAIDYEGETPEPLPNLDFKIVRGDSLLGPNPSASVEVQGTLGWDVDSISRLGRLKADYMRAYTNPDKERLRNAIYDMNEQVETALGSSGVPTGTVDWRVKFAEIFAERGGFDIAVANPPYVRHEEIGSMKPGLRNLYNDSTVARSDLYCYFYIRALQLLCDGGMHVFVCSNSWLDVGYGAKLQQYLLENARVQAIYESAVERQFSTAAINTIISTVEKITGDELYQTVFISFRGEFQQALVNPNLRREVKVSKRSLMEGMLDVSSSQSSRRLVGGKWGGKYLRAPDIYHKVVNEGARPRNILADYARGERYLNTGGADGFFILTDVTPVGANMMKATIRSKEGRDWGSPEFFIEREFLRLGYRKTDSNRLRIEEADCSVLAIPLDTVVRQYEVAKYIAWGEDAGFNRRSVTKTQRPWWRPPLQAQSGATVLWPRTHSDSHRCFYNPNRLISLRFFRLHPKREEHTLPILAVLNSTLFSLLKEIHGRRALGHGALETGLVDILPLPFPDLTDSGVAEVLSAAISPLMLRDVGKLVDEIREPDRIDLDETVLDTFGLDPSLNQEIYEAVIELGDNSRKRARSVQ